jgi:paraquat-inducible protein A
MSAEETAPKKRSTPTQSKGTIWEHIIINCLLWISFLTLAIGIFAPVMTFKKLIFFLIIFVFAILFPVVKIFLLGLIHYFRLWPQEKMKKLLHYLSLVSKWSMLDVFIVALLVVIVRLGITGKVEVRWGLYVFAVSVILSTLATQRLTRITGNPRSE